MLAFEMESSCLFTVAAALGCEAGSVLCAGTNLLTGEATYQGQRLADYAAGQQAMLELVPDRSRRPRPPVLGPRLGGAAGWLIPNLHRFSSYMTRNSSDFVPTRHALVGRWGSGDSVVVEGGLIAAASPKSGPAAATEEIDASGCLVIPGLVQAHVHLCQTLLRGLADDMEVIEWLRRRVWPLEQAHDHRSLHASAMLAMAELLTGGTTAVLTMESNHHTGAAFEAAEQLGIRATIGKALMDRYEPGTEMEVPDSDAAWADQMDLFETWHGSSRRPAAAGAVSPRSPQRHRRHLAPLRGPGRRCRSAAAHPRERESGPGRPAGRLARGPRPGRSSVVGRPVAPVGDGPRGVAQ